MNEGIKCDVPQTEVEFPSDISGELRLKLNPKTGRKRFVCPFMEEESVNCSVGPDKKICKLVQSFINSGSVKVYQLEVQRPGRKPKPLSLSRIS